MPNIATILKSEIIRLARREVRAEVAALRKASASYRSEIAALKKQLREVQSEVRRVAGSTTSQREPAKKQPPSSFKFSASRLKGHRQKLGLSANDFGLLAGASELSIYKWENAKAVPQERFHAGIAAALAMGKREAQASLEALGT